MARARLPPVLPLELLEHIMLLSSAHTQVTLARLSRIFHCIVTPELYRTIELTDQLSVILCCRTLAVKPFFANQVKSFHIACSPEYGTRSLLLLLNNALKNLKSIETLGLHIDSTWTCVLHDCHFPNLLAFVSWFGFDRHLSRFLSKHSNVEFLTLSDHKTVPPPPPRLDVTLPHLQVFAGNSSILSAMSDASRLRSVYLTFGSNDINQPLDHLASAHAPLNSLVCRRQGWNLDLLDLISQRLPSVVQLRIANLPDRPELPVNDVATLLSRFTHLTRFYFQSASHLHCRIPSIEEQYRTVLTWSQACPSLQLCALPTDQGICHNSLMLSSHRSCTLDLHWIKTHTGFWIPNLTETQDIRVLDWILTRLTTASPIIISWCKGVATHLLSDLAVNAKKHPPKHDSFIKNIETAALSFEPNWSAAAFLAEDDSLPPLI